MATADTVREINFTNEIPKHIRPQVLKSLKEVELIRQGKIPKKSARDLLKELEEE